MKLPSGRLVHSRVVDDPGSALAAALDRELTGYAVLEPQETLLLAADARGVLTFDDGVPVLAYHTETDRGGPPALADLAVPGPYRLELVSLSADVLDDLHDTPVLRVPPGMPAERLAGDPDLAARTRANAPDDRVREQPGEDADGDDPAQESAVEAFLENEDKIEAIREQAREEARERAVEWDLDDVCE
ncbi:hypothetical protein BV210_04750 [Halorientalis sp. IM1011]|uniref:hypothetical protein n=1 Tax=Halorientalis sp. IM1011 TaxID=1932360 RepID=UPI00097CCF9A|nr:hypothetical protein [Halorientalis sp. IM1011]AQL42065.1 hypothetical protein BV210_04750 [Halorientalis sp. IM1011]